jgi:hypothetical protein
MSCNRPLCIGVAYDVRVVEGLSGCLVAGRRFTYILTRG